MASRSTPAGGRWRPICSGCRIGAGSYVGASSLVLEGMEIPPGSVALGSPARVIGPVGERHREGIRHGAETYAELAMSCMRRGMARHVGRDGEITRDRTAMTRHEWSGCVEALRGFAARQEALVGQLAPLDRRDPALVTILDARRTVDVSRRLMLDSMLHGASTTVQEVPLAGGEPSSDLESALAAWTSERGFLVAVLSVRVGVDWWRLAEHPVRGPFMLADLVREWVEEDQDLPDRVVAGVAHP